MENKYGFIYITTNKVNGKKYIGQKKIDNSSRCKSYLGSGVNLRKAIDLYGVDNFEREIVEYADSKEELNDLEKSYTKRYNAVESNDYYNLIEGGLSIFELTENNSVPVINIDTGYIFKTIKDASEWSGMSYGMIVKSFDYKHSLSNKFKNLIFKKLEVLEYGHRLCRCCASNIYKKYIGDCCMDCTKDARFNRKDYRALRIKKTDLCYTEEDYWVRSITMNNEFKEYKYYPLYKPLNPKFKK